MVEDTYEGVAAAVRDDRLKEAISLLLTEIKRSDASAKDKDTVDILMRDHTKLERDGIELGPSPQTDGQLRILAKRVLQFNNLIRDDAVRKAAEAAAAEDVAASREAPVKAPSAPMDAGLRGSRAGSVLLKARDLVKNNAMGEILNARGQYWEFAENTMTAVVGPNASGKTTLLQLLSLRHAPTSGSVQLQGCENHDVRFVPAPPPLPIASIDVAIALSARDAGVRGDDLKRDIEFYLYSFDLMKVRERPTHRVSLGQRLRIALAVALAARPKVLLLDEPFANLDLVAKRELLDHLCSPSIRKRNHPMAVVLTSQQIELVEHVADTIILLDSRHAAICWRSPEANHLTHLFEVNVATGVSDESVETIMRRVGDCFYRTGISTYAIEVRAEVSFGSLCCEFESAGVMLREIHDLTVSARRSLLESRYRRVSRKLSVQDEK